MNDDVITPIAAFDMKDGLSTRVISDWPSIDVKSGFRWLHFDLNDPHFKQWAKEHLPDIAARALWQPETRPRCELLPEGLILNLRGVNLNPESDPEDMVSLRLWVTDNVIISARLRKVWAIDTMREAAENGKGPATVGSFLAELTYALTTRIEGISINLEDQTDETEEAVLEGQQLLIGRLGSLRQAVIKMRRFVNPQREAIATLSTLDTRLIAAGELALLRETSNRTRRIVEELDATRDRLSALQDHIDADRAHALSRNGYLLSVIAAIFLPLGFLTGLFGVNVGGMPGVEAEHAFWALAAVSVATGVVLYFVFKFSRWL